MKDLWFISLENWRPHSFYFSRGFALDSHYKAGIIYLLSTVAYVYASDKEAPNPNIRGGVKRVIIIDPDDEPNPKRQKLEGGEYSDDEAQEDDATLDEDNEEASIQLVSNPLESLLGTKPSYRVRKGIEAAITTFKDAAELFLNTHKMQLEEAWRNFDQLTLIKARHEYGMSVPTRSGEPALLFQYPLLSTFTEDKIRASIGNFSELQKLSALHVSRHVFKYNPYQTDEDPQKCSNGRTFLHNLGIGPRELRYEQAAGNIEINLESVSESNYTQAKEVIIKEFQKIKDGAIFANKHLTTV